MLFGFFAACWLVTLLHRVGVVHLGNSLELSLRGIFAAAGGGGWLGGNLYVQRSPFLPPLTRQLYLLAYLIGPPGVASLLWTLLPLTVQHAAPMVPVYACAVSAVFFLIPIVLRWPAGSDRA